MKLHNRLARVLAFLCIAALAACNGGSSSSSPTPPVAPPSGSAVTSRIIGVGDSLTAGFQSGGFLGDPTLPDPFFPGINVPPGQESGFWSQLFMQAKGVSYAQMATPATSVLPLIAKPGLGNQLVPNNPGVTGVALPFLPLSQALPNHGCDSFNQAAYSLSTFAATRMNPTAMPLDLAVPGMTLHEAITLYQPPSPSCVTTGVPPAIAGLYQLFSESGSFYPVLGTYASAVRPATMLNVAASLHASLATVWLGANDVLHYTFSGGRFTAIDTSQQQVQSDMTQIITTLQRSGAAVAVANLPNILGSSFFFSVAIPQGSIAQITQQCELTSNLWCTLTSPLVGVPPANATAIVNGVAAQYGLGPNGYVTLGGVVTLLQSSFTASLDPNGTGSGLGSNYITPSFATRVQSLNDTFNAGINAAITGTGVAKVDIQKVFNDILTGNAADPYAAAALTVNPGKCCSLAYYGGLSSFDGLHPSNTGYALVANMFIDAINAKYGTAIPDTSLASVYAGTGPIPFPDPYAQH